MTRYPCAVLVWDRKASRGGSVVFRACGALSTGIVSIGKDMIFAACSRHNRRLARAGVKLP